MAETNTTCKAIILLIKKIKLKKSVMASYVTQSNDQISSLVHWLSVLQHLIPHKYLGPVSSLIFLLALGFLAVLEV